MTTPTLTPPPASVPNKYGGDPAAFDLAMQAWLTWEATRQPEEVALVNWTAAQTAVATANALAAQADRVLCAAAQAAVTAQSPVTNAAAAAASEAQALVYASLAQAAASQDVYPAWGTGSYTNGDRVTHNWKNYECIQWYYTTGPGAFPPQEPGVEQAGFWLKLDFTNQGSPLRLNPSRITSWFTVPSGYNATSTGPITIAEGVTVTVQDNATWSIT